MLALKANGTPWSGPLGSPAPRSRSSSSRPRQGALAQHLEVAIQGAGLALAALERLADRLARGKLSGGQPARELGCVGLAGSGRGPRPPALIGALRGAPGRGSASIARGTRKNAGSPPADSPGPALASGARASSSARKSPPAGTSARSAPPSASGAASGATSGSTP